MPGKSPGRTDLRAPFVRQAYNGISFRFVCRVGRGGPTGAVAPPVAAGFSPIKGSMVFPSHLETTGRASVHLLISARLTSALGR